MTIQEVQCGMCKHYDSEQYCEVWEQYITNDAFYCACGAKTDRKTEPQFDKDINVRSKDKPQRDCGACEHSRITCRYMERGEPCEYEPKDEPQTDCAWRRDDG